MTTRERCSINTGTDFTAAVAVLVSFAKGPKYVEGLAFVYFQNKLVSCEVV